MVWADEPVMNERAVNEPVMNERAVNEPVVNERAVNERMVDEGMLVASENSHVTRVKPVVDPSVKSMTPGPARPWRERQDKK